MQVLDHVRAHDVHWHCSIVVQVLPPAFSALEVHDEGLRVRVEHPLPEVLPLALVVAPTMVELLVSGTQQLAKGGGHTLVRREGRQLVEQRLIDMHRLCR